MKNILAKAQKPTLKRFASSETLLALDFDGTLASSSKEPRSAQLRAATRRVLAAVAARYPTVVISGRTRADVLARLEGVPLRAVIGNHGLEPSPEAQSYRAIVKGWLPTLRAQIESEQGVEIENKLYSLTIHYRRSKAKRRALTAIRRAVAALGDGARTIECKQAVNVLPAGAPNKTDALLAQQDSLATKTAIYLGDDIADDPVLGSGDPSKLLSVHVGRAANTNAGYYLPKQTDVDRFLASLLELRPGD